MRHRSGTECNRRTRSKGIPAIADDLENKIVDAIFREARNTATTADSGKYGDGDSRAYTERIQRDSADNPEIDSGFFDEDNFETFDKLDISFIGTARCFQASRNTSPDKRAWQRYDNGHQEWTIWSLVIGVRAGKILQGDIYPALL